MCPSARWRNADVARDTMLRMQIGIIFPQHEIGDDPAAIRAFAGAVEDEGFAYLLTFEHVIGRDDYAALPFHEPFVLFGFLAACTRTIELTTGIIVLPQRQTVLVAKQAAEVDMLSGGRLRLGVAVGWNPLEYEALGEEFVQRGQRMDEQIPMMQRLWKEGRVTGAVGREVLADVGLNPLPSRSIPIWLGGQGPAAVRRTAAFGDGLIIAGNAADPGAEENFLDVRARLDAAADAVGRPRGELGLEVSLATKDGDPDSWRAQAERWAALGATHLSVLTYAQEPLTPAEHIERVSLIADAVRPQGGAA